MSLRLVARSSERAMSLRLDDFVYRPALDPLIPLADIIKIGFRDSDPAE